jgi:hypothetical protein
VWCASSRSGVSGRGLYGRAPRLRLGVNGGELMWAARIGLEGELPRRDVGRRLEPESGGDKVSGSATKGPRPAGTRSQAA